MTLPLQINIKHVISLKQRKQIALIVDAEIEISYTNDKQLFYWTKYAYTAKLNTQLLHGDLI